MTSESISSLSGAAVTGVTALPSVSSGVLVEGKYSLAASLAARKINGFIFPA